MSEWNKIPQQIISNLIESMQNRVQMCIKARGGHIKYLINSSFFAFFFQKFKYFESILYESIIIVKYVLVFIKKINLFELF